MHSNALILTLILLSKGKIPNYEASLAWFNSTKHHLCPHPAAGVKALVGQGSWVKVLVSVVVSALRDLVRVRTLAVHSIAAANIEHSAKGTAILSGDASNTEVILPEMLEKDLFRISWI